MSFNDFEIVDMNFVKLSELKSHNSNPVKWKLNYEDNVDDDDIADEDHVGDGAVNDDADDEIADADAVNEDIADADDNFDDVDAFLKALANCLPDIPKAERKVVTQADLDQVGKDLIEAVKGHAIHIIRK